MQFQFAVEGSVAAVHVNPLVDTAALVVPVATAKNLLEPYCTELHVVLVGIVNADQLDPPLTEYAAAVVPDATATQYTVVPMVPPEMSVQVDELGNVAAVHVSPSML